MQHQKALSLDIVGYGDLGQRSVDARHVPGLVLKAQVANAKPWTLEPDALHACRGKALSLLDLRSLDDHHGARRESGVSDHEFFESASNDREFDVTADAKRVAAVLSQCRFRGQNMAHQSILKAWGDVFKLKSGDGGHCLGRDGQYEPGPVAQFRVVMAEKTQPRKELIDLAERLKKHSVFADARRLFEVAKEKDDLTAEKKLHARQQEALCTYKDPTMPRAQRQDDAIALLKNDLQTHPTAETLGLAGAIYKRKWEIGNRVADLGQALGYYLEGHKESSAHEPTRPGNSGRDEDPQKLYRNDDWDAGYTGINAAFVMDKLAALEPDDKKAEDLRSRARALRESLVEQLAKFHDDPDLARESRDDWWLLGTLVEASLGPGAFAPTERGRARGQISAGRAVDHHGQGAESTPPWEFRSTVTQLVELTRVLDIDLRSDDPVCKKTRETLEEFLGPHSGGLDVVLRGKLGLALSGGGFRASLYHIGVLAKLAELDVLRHVEVISCVSGGSIIGAHYYLELRKWLHEHKDSDVLDSQGKINRQHYVDIVKRVQHSFLAGVQKNLRIRLATHLKTGFLTLLLPSYSRTERLGELYDEHLFRQVEDGEGHRTRMLDELLVEPKGTQPMAFVPPRDNWLRCTPVPVLILNATTLNTGHNWQFTATWMGESRWSIDDKIDGNARLRRPYYWQAPEKYRKFPLGRAVAASSCVPGLFEPIVLPKLYPGYAVRLVDGGVHDNQGVAGLLEQDCSWLIVSDASGQMTTEPLIDGGSLKSYGRMSNILMARIREEATEKRTGEA